LAWNGNLNSLQALSSGNFFILWYTRRGPSRKCLAKDGYMVYPQEGGGCSLVHDLDDLDALETASVKTLLSIVDSLLGSYIESCLFST
jgi:hypothetical protein